MIARPINIKVEDSLLAESPYWDANNRLLYWVDIEKKIFHRYNPLSGEYKTCRSEKLAAFIVVGKHGELIVGLQDGIYSMDFNEERFEPIALIDDPGVRLNDGKCDPQGRLWFGTMSLSGQDTTGKLYRFFVGKIETMDSGFKIANGKGWTSDGSMYHADTSKKTIWRYNYNSDNALISNKEQYILTEGDPDGLCVDARDNIYIAMFGSGRVDIYSSDGIKRECIIVPAKEVTSCAFGGSDLKSLFITTAKDGVFQARLKTSGIAEHPCII
jgi:D-xylonolactonase